MLQRKGRSLALSFSRVSLFGIYFWFGALKVVGLSPASTLVQQLFERTIPFMSFGTFIVLFGLFECLIGILFLIKGAERVAFALLIVHLITTLGPLLIVPEATWQGFLVPTMEGQYIIKNLVILAVAVGIVVKK